MTGREHREQAERLIETAVYRDEDGNIQRYDDGTPMIRADMGEAIALAHVHATLAVAAAADQTRWADR